MTHSGKLLVRFDRGRPTAPPPRRCAAPGSSCDTAELPPTDDPDEFHDHQLEGLRAELADGSVVGTVREVVHGPGGELLVLARAEAPGCTRPVRAGHRADRRPGRGRLVLTPPEGLLDVE